MRSVPAENHGDDDGSEGCMLWEERIERLIFEAERRQGRGNVGAPQHAQPRVHGGEGGNWGQPGGIFDEGDARPEAATLDA